MTFRVDRVHVEIDGGQEFEGTQEIVFDLPPEHPLVAELLAWNDARLLAEAQAAGPADLGLGW